MTPHAPGTADGRESADDSQGTQNPWGSADGTVLHSDHTFRASWRQPEDVDRWLRERAEGRVLNVCAGKSPLGDVRVDADPQQPGVIPADMRRLPFADASFDTVVFDPPWKLGYFQRQAPFFECERVCNPGGLILMNAKWVAESEHTTLDGPVVVRADDRWANVSVIVPHRKQADQTTFADLPSSTTTAGESVTATADVATLRVTTGVAEVSVE